MSDARFSQALTLTPMARRGLLALAALALFFMFDRLSLHVQQKKMDLQLLRSQHSKLVQIANGEDPTRLLEEAQTLRNQAQSEILNEGTTGLNSAKLQLELVGLLDQCGIKNASLVLESETPDIEGQIFEIEAGLRGQADLLALSNCMHELAEHSTRIHIRAFRWNSAQQVNMQLQALARNDGQSAS